MMKKLNYVSFENEFVKFCSGDINTELDYGGKEKPTRENIDRYILLPAAMTKDEKEERLVFNDSIDKTALSRFRKGERSVPKAVLEAFRRDNAVDVAAERFSKILPGVVRGKNKMGLLYAISDIIQQDYDIPKIHMKRFQRELEDAEEELGKEIAHGNPLSEGTDTKCFFLFLADTLTFSILRDEIVHEAPKLSRKVGRVLKELDITNDVEELESIIGEMCLAIMDENDFHPGVIMVKAINDTEFTDDDFRQIVLSSLPILHLLNPAIARLLLPIQTFITMLDINEAPSFLSKEGKYGIANKYGLPRGVIRLHDIEVGTEHVELITNVGGHKFYSEFDFNEDGSVKNSRKVYPYEDL